jgi:ArsR family transcriptional regulator, arsenate/arsenite/antimonite-responsive transcriptional repressor
LMQPVRIVGNLESAQVLVDPVRRMILDLLASREMTEAEVAKKLEFSQASISHHVKELEGAGLVKIVRKEIESHGILQKFYRATALVIMMDYEKMPYSIRRYTLALYMERLRGALAALSVGDSNPELTWDSVEALSDALAIEVVAVARRVRDIPAAQSREDLLLEIYTTALRSLAQKPEGKVLRQLLKVPVAGHASIGARKG